MNMEQEYNNELLTAISWEDNVCKVANYQDKHKRFGIVYGTESKDFTIIHQLDSFEPEVIMLSKENVERLVQFYNTL
jgi:hypothetical protein